MSEIDINKMTNYSTKLKSSASLVKKGNHNFDPHVHFNCRKSKIESDILFVTSQVLLAEFNFKK